MKNLPNFDEFKNYQPLIEKASSSEIEFLKSILNENNEYQESDINEGSIFNDIKTSLSKFFLGSLSRANMIDKTRQIIVQNEIDLYTGNLELTDEIEDMEEKLNAAKKISDNIQVTALLKQLKLKEEEKKNFVNNLKTKLSSIKSKLESEIIQNNSRLEEYYEAGRLQDEVKIAQAKYDLAKNRSDNSELLDKFKKQVEKSQEVADEKAQDLMKKGEEARKEELSKNKKKGVLSPETEGKVISSKSPSAIIERKAELKKEIADLESALEKEIDLLIRKIEKNPESVSPNKIAASKEKLIKLEGDIRTRRELIKFFESLGKNRTELKRKLAKESEVTRYVNSINNIFSSSKSGKSESSKAIDSAFNIKGETTTNPRKLRIVKSKILGSGS
jgi:hypothetical protein